MSSLTKTVLQLQQERDSLAGKPTAEEGQRRSSQELREQISLLQQQLDASLTPSEKLPNTSLSLNQLGDSPLLSSSSTSPAQKKNSGFYPDTSLVSSSDGRLHPPNCSTLSQGSPPKYSPLLQTSSPSSEALNLKQKLAEARQTCQKLDQQQSSRRTEMSRMQGSLQALIKIQEHLTTENHSLSQTFSAMEEEKEALKQEIKRLTSRLVGVEEQLAAVNAGVGALWDSLRKELESVWGQSKPSSNLHGSLTQSSSSSSSLAQLRDTALGMVATLQRQQEELEALSSQLQAAKEENEARGKEVEILEGKMSAIGSQVAAVQGELEEKERLVNEKEEKVTSLQKLLSNEQQRAGKDREVVKERSAQEMERIRRDLDNQYQVMTA